MSSSKKKVTPSKPEHKTAPGRSALKYIGLAIVALAVIGLIFSSVFSGSRGGQNQLAFGRYGDRDIIYRYNNSFGQAVENEMEKYSSSVDQDNQFFTFVRFMAWQQAFTTVAVNTAIAYQLDESGYEVSSRAVDRRIVEFGPFRTADGEFDEVAYRAASSVRKNSIREQFREQITLETWSRDVLESPYRSSAQLDFLQDMKTTVRSYNYVTIPFTDYPDESILAFARENSDLFRRRPISRITVTDEETAREVESRYEENRLDIGAFGALAGEYSEDGYRDAGGSMGLADFYEISELVGSQNANQIFDRSEGDTAGPFETEYGWILFRVDGAMAEDDLEGRVDEIRDYMLQNETGLVEDTLIARADILRLDAIESGSLEEAQTLEDLDVRTTPTFPINFGGDPMLDGSPENGGDQNLSGTQSSEEFWSKIAVLDEVGAISEPVVLNGAVALFELAAIEREDDLDYWDLIVEGETARSRQDDFQAAVLSEESDLFENNFNETYTRIFPAQVQG